MNNLIQSFIQHRQKIITNQCIVIENTCGLDKFGDPIRKWHHCYKKEAIAARLREIDEFIDYLETKVTVDLPA